MPARAPTDPLEDVARLLERFTPGQLEEILPRLDPADVAIIERVLGDKAKSGWRSNPVAMAHHLTNGTIKQYAYSQLLGEKFVDAVEGRSIRQIWNIPARFGKTLVASQWGPVWAFDRNPAIKIALTSYGNDLAHKNATDVRDLLVQHGDVLGCRLRKDRRRGDRFVTEEGGGLIGAGIGSALTGFGADGAICDDPFKNWQEAHSEARRLLVWNWFRSVLRTRLERDDSFIIVVQTRWHEDDLTGKLLQSDLEGEGEDWELIRLPAIAEAPNPKAAQLWMRLPDPLGRARGEPLEPLRFSLESSLQRARALGSYLAAGLEQQRPAPEEGTDIMRAWWKWYDEPPPKFDASCTSWDMKLKDKEAGDFVVGQAWGRTGGDYWALDQLRGQWNQTTTKTAIVLMQVRHPKIRMHVVENTGNGPEVMAELRRAQPGYSVSEETRSELGITDDEVPKVNALFRRGMSGLLPEIVKGDKRVRARAQTPLVEAGNVHLPLRSHWAEGFVDEASTFPNGSHDDQVDAWSQALKRLAGGRGTSTKPTGTVKTPSPGARSAPAKPTVGRSINQAVRTARPRRGVIRR